MLVFTWNINSMYLTPTVIISDVYILFQMSISFSVVQFGKLNHYDRIFCVFHCFLKWPMTVSVYIKWANSNFLENSKKIYWIYCCGEHVPIVMYPWFQLEVDYKPTNKCALSSEDFTEPPCHPPKVCKTYSCAKTPKGSGGPGAHGGPQEGPGLV